MSLISCNRRQLLHYSTHFQCFPFDGFSSPPGPHPVDGLCLEHADYRLRERVVMTITHAANLRLDHSFGQTFSLADRHVLAAPVAVVDEITDRAAFE